ncbi:molecular chaperone DnaK [Candidatus Sumerlaeota bacterium]
MANPEQESQIVIGIDLGTTNSVVAVVQGGEPLVLPNIEGKNRTPSIVAIAADDTTLVGEVAQRQIVTNPQRTVSAVKRLMGRTLADIEQAGERFPFSVVADDNGHLLVDIDGVGYTPQQISSLILAKLKQGAELALGQEVRQAVITVPAYFDDLQRQATIEAGEMAGLEVLRLVNEPTAAAMAYGLDRSFEGIAAVYDFGGGTFDISILEIMGNSYEVLTSSGDSHLGGEDIDVLILNQVAEKFLAEHGVDLRADPMSLRRLKDAAEQAKCELSATSQTRISLPFVAQKDNAPLHLDLALTRSELEELITPLVNKTLDCCRQAMKDAGLKRSRLDRIILVGGSTRIPLVQDMVENFFNLDLFRGVNPDEIVAMGAATQGSVMSGQLQDVVLLEVTPHSLGIEIKDGKFSPIIEKNATIPIKAAKTFTTTQDLQELVKIHVLQGEDENVINNRSLGEFCLSGIKALKAGVPRIDVVFFINSDGVVEIEATDVLSGKGESLRVLHSFASDGEQSLRQTRRSTRRRKRESSSQIKGQPMEGVQGTDLGGETSQAFAEVTAGATPTEALSLMVSELADTASRPAATAPGTSPDDTVVGETTVVASPTGVTADDESLLEHLADLPEAIKDAEAILQREELSDEDRQALADILPEYEALAGSHPEDFKVHSAWVKMLVVVGQIEKALAEIDRLEDQFPEHPQELLALHNRLLTAAPRFGDGLCARANLLEILDLEDEAIQDYERALAQDSDNSEIIRKLHRLYERQLKRQSNKAPIQFKIVKLQLKRNEIDEAIATLQQLASESDYTEKASKILGLCFWQKHMYYLAYQRFRDLPVDEEMKDILYRLASDMEAAEQLANARYALERIYELDVNFRDVKKRIDKISELIKVQQETLQADGPAVTPGRVLNDSRFLVYEEINRGSMGIIYRAKDKVLDEIVALKVLNDYFYADPEAVERFKREARAAKRLSHPNIVRIHDMYETSGKRFISMEFIEGEDLKQLLAEKKRLDWSAMRKLVYQICDALKYAHKINIIHRDIKPANIMITSDDEVRITDFGIAKLLHAEDMTKPSNMVMGTPLYMAPEQIEGGEIDARTDIYTLGAMLFELFSGRPPYCEGNIEYQHVNAEIPSLSEDVPSLLAEVVYKCMAKKPDDRYQSVAEIEKALQAAEENL